MRSTIYTVFSGPHFVEQNMAGKLATAQEADLALPKGSLILVTGASGYIASNVVHEALEAGYRVRGTARSEEKCQKTKQSSNNHPNYSTAVVADFQHEGAFDEAMKGVHAVIHLASDLTFGSDPNQVITPTVAGVLSILKSAARQPSVKRFVLTSSSAAVLTPKLNQEFSVRKDDWNQEALDVAWAPPPYNPDRAFHVYAASKLEAEKALWKFVKEEKPNFVANAVLPNVNWGRVIDASGASGGMLPGIVKNGSFPPGMVPRRCAEQVCGGTAVLTRLQNGSSMSSTMPGFMSSPPCSTRRSRMSASLRLPSPSTGRKC